MGDIADRPIPYSMGLNLAQEPFRLRGSRERNESYWWRRATVLAGYMEFQASWTVRWISFPLAGYSTTASDLNYTQTVPGFRPVSDEVSLSQKKLMAQKPQTLASLATSAPDDIVKTMLDSRKTGAVLEWKGCACVGGDRRW